MSLMNEFKTIELELRQVFPKGSIFGLRLDGKSFSKFTKQFEKPFSKDFEKYMNESLMTVIEQVLPTPLTAYVQSDEMTIIWDSSTIEPPFAGKIEKLLSLSAAAATAGFMRAAGDLKGLPLFDARAFVLKDYEQVSDYITWRRLDARKNAISMAVSHLHSHGYLMGVSTSERIGLLQGTPFENIPEGTFNGRILKRDDNAKYSLVDATRDVTDETLALSYSWALNRIKDRVYSS